MNQTSFTSKIIRSIRAIKFLFLVAIIAGVVWYIRSRPIPVSSHTIVTGPVVRSVMGTGTLEARIRTTISPKISGRIAEVLVDQGAVVKAGQSDPETREFTVDVRVLQLPETWAISQRANVFIETARVDTTIEHSMYSTPSIPWRTGLFMSQTIS